jgi:hypothetical protein
VKSLIRENPAGPTRQRPRGRRGEHQEAGACLAGRTLLVLARLHGYAEIVHLLEQAGAR